MDAIWRMKQVSCGDGTKSAGIRLGQCQLGMVFTFSNGWGKAKE